MYTNAANIVDTLTFILNQEQEFFREYLLIYDSQVGSREYPLSILKGIYNNRPHGVLPALEIEVNNESVEWSSTRTQRTRYELELLLTVKNSNQEFGLEYISGLVQRVKIVLTDPRRLQSRIVNREGKIQTKWNVNGEFVPLVILDSLIDNISYKSSQEGTIRKASMSWWGLFQESFPPEAFVNHYPHYPNPDPLPLPNPDKPIP